MAEGLHKRRALWLRANRSIARPGTVPEVHADGENVTFRFDVAGIVEPTKLVLRCNAQGGVWASITFEPHALRHKE